MQLNLHTKIKQNIQHLSQERCHFASKKNDQLLQNFVDDLMLFAEIKKCSDIHIEPQESVIRVRMRIDGVLSEQFLLPKFILEQLSCKLKILAHMNIAQSRLPQEGKLLFEFHHGLKIHIRLSFCPTVQGEKIVFRLLKDHPSALAINELGLSQEQLNVFLQAIAHPHGLILITGPTGGGKTSTLYAALNHMNRPDKNIITLEDPVEVNLPGINQIAIKGDLNFSSILRSILRQDPDIIMIGEIRDEETAKIAIQAANTGHLVFATLHTNNCIESIHRLKHMNIDQHDLISCLKLIVSQRLLRKKCKNCTASQTNDCLCHEGYLGRVGLFEMLSFDEKFKDYLLENKIIQESALSAFPPFLPLHVKVLDYIENDITTLEEAKRALNISITS